MSAPNRYRKVAQPGFMLDCWALKEIHVSQLLGPDRVPCAKRARPGHLTCHWHRDREDAAQALKARLAAKEKP